MLLFRASQAEGGARARPADSRKAAPLPFLFYKIKNFDFGLDLHSVTCKRVRTCVDAYSPVFKSMIDAAKRFRALAGFDPETSGMAVKNLRTLPWVQGGAAQGESEVLSMGDHFCVGLCPTVAGTKGAKGRGARRATFEALAQPVDQLSTNGLRSDISEGMTKLLNYLAWF